MKLSHATLLLTSRDRVTQQVARRTLDKESSQRRIQFKPVTYSRNIMAENPGAHRQVLLKHVKNTANVEDATSRRKQAEALPLQGQMLRASNLTADGIWAVAVSKLGSEAMKFALNAASDTLPHNSNLARWYRGSCTDQCKLCGKKQTLLHVLNNCEVALNLRRYNMRHDRILQLIVCQAFKVIHNLNCLDFHEYLSFNESRTRSHRLSLRPTGSRINSFRYSFFINIPFLWNTLPVDILDATSLSTFKSKLKNFLS